MHHRLHWRVLLRNFILLLLFPLPSARLLLLGQQHLPLLTPLPVIALLAHQLLALHLRATMACGCQSSISKMLAACGPCARAACGLLTASSKSSCPGASASIVSNLSGVISSPLL